MLALRCRLVPTWHLSKRASFEPRTTILFRDTMEALKSDVDKDDFYFTLNKVKLMKAKEKVSDQHSLRFLLKFHTIITGYALDLTNKVS